MLTVAGIYLAFQVPISVFPETNFPRVVIGVDNGVMPVEQMEVTITRPIEDAVNSVPGLDTVRSTTSRGSAEVSLFFDWNVDMVTARCSWSMRRSPWCSRRCRRRRTSPPTASPSPPSRSSATASPPTPYLRPQLWEIATYDLKPPLNRVAGVSTVIVQGGQVPEFHVVPNLALLQAPASPSPIW